MSCNEIDLSKISVFFAFFLDSTIELLWCDLGHWLVPTNKLYHGYIVYIFFHDWLKDTYRIQPFSFTKFVRTVHKCMVFTISYHGKHNSVVWFYALWWDSQLSWGIVDDESEDIRCVWLAMQLRWRGDAKCHVCISTHTSWIIDRCKSV